jgi:hypothetical protein
MFEHLAAETRIVVTGPQRSGTRIAAQMIAGDTGHRFVDEADFNFIDEQLWRDVLASDDPFVVQCPTMFRFVVDDADPRLFVVLMRRDLAAIHASEARIDWNERYEPFELHRFGLEQGDAAAIKYEYWDSHPRPARYLEIEYDDLVAHPSFIRDREHFGPHQTS